MSNMLATGAAFLASQLLSHASDCVTYSRGAVSMPIEATKGSTTFDSEAGDGSVTRYESIDFIVSSQKLLPLLGEPQDGDRIHDGEHTYEVLALTGSAPFKYCDRHRLMLRIHTKQIS